VTAAIPGHRRSCAVAAADVATANPRQGEDVRATSPPPEPVVIDGGDRACTALLLELRGRTCDLPAGTVIHLIAPDPAAPIDLPVWSHMTGHAYLDPVRAATPAYALHTTAAPFATNSASPWKRRP
jgi:tRNA 2-thiouridine synthesizing protein A